MNAVDTNVLVYAVDESEPQKSRRAVQLIRTLSAADTPLVIPWQVATEFLACLRRWETAGRITRESTNAYLNQFVLSLPVIFPTIDTLRLALDLSSRFSLSHWDSMLLAACLEAGVNSLYTEDLGAGQSYDLVRTVNPFAAQQS
jgi:predicted nucleic acid-binding protein